MKIYIIICFLCLSKLFSQNNFCGFDLLQENYFNWHPELKLNGFEKIADTNGLNENNKTRGSVYVIPVVFHVLYDSPLENISDAQICDAIQMLNEDFRKKNYDTAYTISYFKGIAADAEIEFRLATIDPSGNPTSGIDRIHTTLTHNASDISKLNQWPPSQYLNIWTVDSLAITQGVSGVKGYAYGPAVAALYPQYDGVLMRHDCIGRFGDPSGSIFQSTWARILTHEIGHYFNLLHTWGNSLGVGTSCTGDDFVADTPPTAGSLWCTNLYLSTCGYLDNVQNYMNYSYCYTMFTQGQVARMKAALNSSVAYRNNLSTSSNLSLTGTANYQACSTVNLKVLLHHSNQVVIYPNPSSGVFNVDYDKEFVIEVYDVLGQTILKQPNLKQFDLSNHKKGIYFVNIYNSTKSHKQPVVIE